MEPCRRSSQRSVSRGRDPTVQQWNDLSPWAVRGTMGDKRPKPLPPVSLHCWWEGRGGVRGKVLLRFKGLFYFSSSCSYFGSNKFTLYLSVEPVLPFECFLPILISTHKAFIKFSLLCPTVAEEGEWVYFVSAWHLATVKAPHRVISFPKRNCSMSVILSTG